MASGGAGDPPPSAAPSIIATVSCGSVVAHEFFLSLFPYQKPFSAGQTPLGVLTDPDVFYYDESSPHPEETYDSFLSVFRRVILNRWEPWMSPLRKDQTRIFISVLSTSSHPFRGKGSAKS